MPSRVRLKPTLLSGQSSRGFSRIREALRVAQNQGTGESRPVSPAKAENPGPSRSAKADATFLQRTLRGFVAPRTFAGGADGSDAEGVNHAGLEAGHAGFPFGGRFAVGPGGGV